MILFEELKRRNVFRVAIAYVITSWLLAQVLEIVLDSFGSPEWVMKTILVVLAAGLPLALILAWAFEMTPEGIKKERDVDRSKSITGKTGRKLNFTIIGILAVAVVFLLVDRFSEKKSEPAAAATSVEVADSQDEKRTLSPAETTTKSIAVLPFVNMSSDPEQDYFSDGISEEILNALARVKELKVAGRTSSFAFKGKDQDLRVIGETLGVGHILEGSVRKSGNIVRITAQLIQVEDGFHLWSDTYDRELDDVFAIQDEIATAILEQLKAALISGDLAAMESRRTNSKAYDLYLLAKQRMYERKELPLQSALALLDEAIVLDPDYAPAHAQRAIVTLLLRDEMYGSIPKEQAIAQAKLYIDKALALDPELAEANAALGLYHISRPQESELAIEPLKKALDINPNMVNAANWLGSALANLGRIPEAIAMYEDMVERDPFYRPGISTAVGIFNGTGKSDQSWALIDRISPFFPEDPMLLQLKATTFLSEGRPGDAVPLLESAIELEPSSTPSRIQLGFALIGSGQYQRAAEIDFPRIKAFALFLLDRTEEATIITAKLAADGENVSDHINYLVMSEKYTEVINFFETRWSGFDAFEADFPPIGRGAVYTYGDLAQAYASVGNEERFQESMVRYRKHIDRLKDFGFEYNGIYFLEATYFTLAGDHESALKNLGLAVDNGWLGYPRISKECVQLKPLEGDPEFRAIQARMVQHLNEERAKVNLGPMSI